MKRLLFGASIIIAMHTAASADAMTADTEKVVLTSIAQDQSKSFFDSRTKEDIQRMIDVEAGFNAELKSEADATAAASANDSAG